MTRGIEFPAHCVVFQGRRLGYFSLLATQYSNITGTCMLLTCRGKFRITSCGDKFAVLEGGSTWLNDGYNESLTPGFPELTSCWDDQFTGRHTMDFGLI